MRRAKIAATKRAEEIFTQLMRLADRNERLFSTYAKRLTRAMGECEKQVDALVALPGSTSAAADVIESAFRTYDSLANRWQTGCARNNAKIAVLLDKLWPVLRLIGARERGRLVASFQFWLQKKREGKYGHANTNAGN
jgi:hypothetical protein